MINNLIQDATNQLQQNGLFVDQTALGIFKITGKSRLDLINRMSTQQLMQLKAGEGAATVLTTDIGRIIDRLFVYQDSDQAWMICSRGNNQAIHDYLLRYVFFNDEFHITDLTDKMAIWGIHGTPAGEKLSTLFSIPELPQLPLHHWRTVTKEGNELSVHRTDSLSASPAYWLIAPEGMKEEITQSLLDASIISIDQPVFNSLRIQAGMPLFGHELTTDYIPLESNLLADISFNKGCYLGQEIIARMDSRGKLAKRLVRLHIAESVPVGSDVLTDKGKKAGKITSIAPGIAGYVGLGYLKTAVLTEQPPLKIDEISCTVEEIA